MEIMFIAISLAICIALAAGYALGKFRESYRNVIQKLQQEIDDLKKAANTKSRNPYLTNCGLEDAFSVADDVRRSIEYANLRSKVIQDILRKIHTDPNGYDEDRPNSKREVIK